MKSLPSPVPRPPAVAGQFYPADPERLAETVEGFLGAVPQGRVESVAALLSPHAGYDYSGKVAACAYRALPAAAFNSVVVVGAGHRKAVAGAALYPGDYVSPLGALLFDAELAERMLAETELIVPDPTAHAGEHSVEVQVPFILKTLGSVKAVCLVMNTEELDDAVVVGQALAKCLAGRRTLLVASTDLSHFPSSAVADLVDPTTLEALATMDPATFWLSNKCMMNRGVPGLGTTCCGAAAVAAVMAAAKDLGATGMRLLERTHSGAVTGEGDGPRVVGYAAAVFIRGGPSGPRALAAEERGALLACAREAIAERFAGGREARGELSPMARLNLPGSAFVTLTDAEGELRGCIGDLEPRQTLLDSVRRNAASAAFADPRFPALCADEFAGIGIEVSVVSPKRTAHWSEVRPGDGVVVERGGRSGVFLPQVWEKISDPAEFLGILCSQKAGLPREAYRQPGTTLKVFSVEKMAEKGEK
ncbi:MAG: AmmeMemoRadiSam system protein B [Elusimicrobia bacterium]|nr:AmmeMemoRadiSam system protein B [Elusimicrobiota bacterium]